MCTIESYLSGASRNAPLSDQPEGSRTLWQTVGLLMTASTTGAAIFSSVSMNQNSATAHTYP